MESNRAQLTHQQIVEDPNEVWNSFISIIANVGDQLALSPLQQNVSLVFRYYSEVMNGGHLQFLENNGIAEMRKTSAALANLGLTQFKELLDDAIIIAGKPDRPKIESVEEFVAAAGEGHYSKLDDAFYGIDSQIMAFFEDHLRENREEYIEVID